MENGLWLLDDNHEATTNNKQAEWSNKRRLIVRIMSLDVFVDAVWWDVVTQTRMFGTIWRGEETRRSRLKTFAG
jgi:hypothetical protein